MACSSEMISYIRSACSLAFVRCEDTDVYWQKADVLCRPPRSTLWCWGRLWAGVLSIIRTCLQADAL